jgi:DNA-binding response OmpR family regulator
VKSVLIIDDDNIQLNYLEGILSAKFSVFKADNPIKGWEKFSQSNFDAIIVDAHMPVINGFEFVLKIQRDWPHKFPAVFILSADSSQSIKIQALKLGISDFLWPNMTQEEMVLRIENRLEKEEEKKSDLIHQYKKIKINISSMKAFLNDTKLDLTSIEFKMLTFMVAHPNEIIKRSELKEFIWPQTVVLDKTLNTHLTNLRIKLKDASIDLKSVKNEGVILS